MSDTEMRNTKVSDTEMSDTEMRNTKVSDTEMSGTEMRNTKMRDTVLRAENLSRHYPVRSGLRTETLHAVREVSFSLKSGRTLAVVGESGCGKSTLARMVTMIEHPDAGTLTIGDTDLMSATSEQKRALRSQVQIVFQNPYGSLNPRQKIFSALEEPLRYRDDLPVSERRDRATTMLARVGLRPEHGDRYPHMFSGGQRQRIAIARALMPEPQILVLDEPVSALDVSVQAQVLNLLADLREQFSLAYLFISHDLSVVRHIADEVLVMYMGRVQEQADKNTLFDNPRHPYTRALLSATPNPDPAVREDKRRILLKGETPSPMAPPSGCTFHPRCPLAFGRCSGESPALLHQPQGQAEDPAEDSAEDSATTSRATISHAVACHAVEESR